MALRVKDSIVFFIAALGVFSFGPCDNGADRASGDGQDYKASCSTTPGGEHITVLAGIDILEINFNYSIPCDIGPICAGATFTSTMHTNQFFGPRHVFDEWSVTPGLGTSRTSSINTRGWQGTDHVVIQVKSNQTGEAILATCDFTLTVIDPRPDNPELTSPSHRKGQPSCERSLTVTWSTPTAHRGVGGYSYVIVNQSDPVYDINRWPDESADLAQSTTAFTTQPLEPGHTWEFNLRTIDSGGLAAEFYASFWVKVEYCDVIVKRPRSGDTFEVGDWVNTLWEQITFDGNDVSGGYDVEAIDLLNGLDVVTNLVVNQPNILSSGFQVPSVTPGSEYRVRLTLRRNPAGDMFPELPEVFLGLSDTFSITDSGG